jgi:uroporphyrinogen-III decarboxylase
MSLCYWHTQRQDYFAHLHFLVWHLGHDITSDVDPENMAVLVGAVHNFRSSQ